MLHSVAASRVCPWHRDHRQNACQAAIRQSAYCRSGCRTFLTRDSHARLPRRACRRARQRAQGRCPWRCATSPGGVRPTVSRRDKARPGCVLALADGARGRTRTGKGVNPADFKSAASTISPPGRAPPRVYVSAGRWPRSGSARRICRLVHVVKTALDRLSSTSRNGHKKPRTARASAGRMFWRPRSELNRRTRICSPLHNHSATRPVTSPSIAPGAAFAFASAVKNETPQAGSVCSVMTPGA